MNVSEQLLGTLKNYKSLAEQVNAALQAEAGMSHAEVMTLAAKVFVVTESLEALVDAIEPKIHFADPRPAWQEHNATVCGKFTDRRTSDRSRVTCKQCRGTKIFKGEQ